MDCRILKQKEKKIQEIRKRKKKIKVKKKIGERKNSDRNRYISCLGEFPY